MKKGLKNYLYQTAYQLLIVLTPLLTAPCLARALGTEGIGIYSYTANFANYFLMFAMLGMANYGARYIAQNRDDKQKLSYSFYSIYFCQCICTGWERYKLYGSELTVMFAEERKRYNSGLLPTKYNFFDETKYNRISLVDEINPKVNTFNILIKKEIEILFIRL